MSEMQSVGDYEFNSSDILGHGAFAIVYRGRVKQSGEHVAIKSITKSKLPPNAIAHLSKEIAVLKELSSNPNNGNLVKLLDCQETPTHVFLVMEYCNGGDLGDFLFKNGTLNESTIRHFVRQIANGMTTLNSKGILHRDLKPHNILLNFVNPTQNIRPNLEDVTLKIADFGFARFLGEGVMAATVCGSPNYMAPEIITGATCDLKADLYSIGVIIYQCLNGRVPFRAKTPLKLKEFYIQNQILKPWIHIDTSTELKALISGLLQRHGGDRLNFNEFFSHPFLNPAPVVEPKHLPTISVPVPVAELIKSSVSESDRDSAYSSLDEEDADFVIIQRQSIAKYSPICIPEPDVEDTKPTGKIPATSATWSPDVRNLSPPRVQFSPTPKLKEALPPSSIFGSHTFSSNTLLFAFEPPPLTNEIFYHKSHTSTFAKLNFALTLSDCASNLAKLKGAPSLVAKNVTESGGASEQLTLYIRSLQLLSSALRLAKEEIEEKRLHPVPEVRKILQKLNAKFKENFSVTKKLRTNIAKCVIGTSGSANQLLYSHAIEICKSVALDECLDSGAGNEIQKYQTAQTLFHSLLEEVESDVDRALLQKYKSIVEKRILAIQRQQLHWAGSG